jgi:hypothetical protein
MSSSVPQRTSAGIAIPPAPKVFDATFGSVGGVDGGHLWLAFGAPLGSVIPSAHSIKPVLVDSDEDNVCPICLDRKPGGAQLVPCGHTQLCLPCAKGLINTVTKASCPYCFAPIHDIVELSRSGSF